MKIIEIKSIENNGHRNQIGDFKIIPDGWAVVPESLETPNFPFGNIVVEEINGVMTVTQWTACPCPKPEPILKLTNSIDLSSYFAFCAGVNDNSIDCAFGKNNEDRILNLGLQLAMYSWFCGDSKTDYPYTELCNCCTLPEIEKNNVAFKELWENNTLRVLYMRPYPSERVLSEMNTINGERTVEITNEDIKAGLIWSEWRFASNPVNTDATLYIDGVLATELKSNITKIGAYWKAGLAIKLSDCGINTPGSYVFKLQSTSQAHVTLYRKATTE